MPKRTQTPGSAQAGSASSAAQHRVRKVALWAASAAGVALIGGIVKVVLDSYGPTIQDKLLAGPPISVLTKNWGPEFLLPPNQVVTKNTAIPKAFRAFEAWGDERNATQVVTDLSLVVEGKRNHTVVITDMHARVVEELPPPPGTVLRYPGAEGEQETVGLFLGVDDPNPVARRTDEFGQPLLEPYFEGHYVTLTNGEQVVFRVKAQAKRCDCTWVIDMDLVVDGEPQTFTVMDGSEPFHTTSCRDASSGFLLGFIATEGPPLIPLAVRGDQSGRFLEPACPY